MQTILVIDDDPNIRAIYHSVLTPSETTENQRLFDQLVESLFGENNTIKSPRYHLLEASQGAEGVEIVKNSLAEGAPIALAFIDMRMPPGMDGLDTAEAILALDPRIEIVFVTAFNDHSPRMFATRLGKKRFFFLRKPFENLEIQQFASSLTYFWEMERRRAMLEREKEIFLSNSSHELRQPLQIILGACDTLLECQLSESQRVQFIQDIQREAQALCKLATSIEDLQAIDWENPVASKAKFSVNRIAEKILRHLRKESDKKGLILRAEIEEKSLWVRGEAARIEEVLLHLLANAIHNTKQGQVVLHVEAIDQFVRFSVVDTGVGIAPNEVENITKSLYRVPETAIQNRGHGLGLAIANRVLQNHQSRLEIQSTLGEGSRFSFLLPRCKVGDVEK